MSDRMERGRVAAAEMERRLRPLVEAQPREHQSVLMAALERGAAARYRSWAEAAASESERRGLLDCAAREEEIASAAEKLSPDAPAAETLLAPLLPELRAAYDAVYRGHPREEQMAIQASAERVGASAWRTFAKQESRPEALAALEHCARLEEESAVYLEELLGG